MLKVFFQWLKRWREMGILFPYFKQRPKVEAYKKRVFTLEDHVVFYVKPYAWVILPLKTDYMGLQGRREHKTAKSWSFDQSCAQPLSRVWLFLCEPMDSSLLGSSVHGIFQARILESVAISSSRGSSWPRDWTWVSCISCIVGRFFIAEPSGMAWPNLSLLHLS